MEKKIKKIPCLSDKSCDGHLIFKRINYTIKLKDKTVSVPNIEVWECDLCGERFYPYEASKKIDLYKEYSGRLMLRLEPELHWKLARVANKHHRSLNQEVNYLLENTLK
ncbi:MAG: toxin-antitoxin system HicB family antitoxin [Candidatus Omnitrophota bacterium]